MLLLRGDIAYNWQNWFPRVTPQPSSLDEFLRETITDCNEAIGVFEDLRSKSEAAVRFACSSELAKANCIRATASMDLNIVDWNCIFGDLDRALRFWTDPDLRLHDAPWWIKCVEQYVRCLSKMGQSRRALELALTAYRERLSLFEAISDPQATFELIRAAPHLPNEVAVLYTCLGQPEQALRNNCV